MFVDAVTTSAVVAELNQKILGGRVQAVIEVDEHSIGFEIYARQRHYLLASIDPKTARCQLVSEKLRRGTEKPSTVALLMRKYLDGAHLKAITQPAWERIIHFDFSGESGDTRLIVETMDKRSNILLTADGTILDSLKRVGSDQNRYRVMLPGKPYVPPPSQEKMLPELVRANHLVDFLKASPDAPAWRALVSNIAGISPLFAREIIYRASEDAEAPTFDLSGDVVFAAFYTMIADVDHSRWSPCVAKPKEGEGFTAFAAYTLTHMENVEARDSISAAMANYFGAPVGTEAYSAGKETVQAQLDEALDRLRRKLASLERQAASDEQIEALRKKGELLYAYAYSIQPKQASFEAQYDPEGPMLTIELDPAVNAIENAKRYFERYEKSKRAHEEIPGLVKIARQELNYLEQLATDLTLAESWPEIDEVRQSLQEGGYWRGPRIRGPQGGKPGIRRLTTPEGFVIFVGRNSAQNHELVTKRSAPLDLWLHVRGIPGSHVIIKNDGRSIPDNVIQRAAELAAYYSAGRANTLVEVDVTERRYVRPIRGGKPGMVNYKKERTLTVKPRKDDQP
jgi:predicted ribosome quality control (RQC) complex YloA/Tae2 family protein